MSDTTASRPAHGIIDLHSHWFSPSSLKLLGQRNSSPRIFEPQPGRFEFHRAGAGTSTQPFSLESQWFDVDQRIAHLDAHGVRHQLISWPTTIGVDAAISAAESIPLWSAYNDELAQLVGRHPKRLSAVAALATSDIAWSARELARAHEELGLIGAVLPVNGFASLAAARQFAPLFAVAQKYRSHIYLHTGYANPLIPGQPPVFLHSDAVGVRNVLDLAWQFASSYVTLGFTEFLDDYPDVTIQIAMLGGMGTIANIVELGQQASGHFSDARPTERLKRLLLDTGAAGRGPHAIALATRVFGASQVVFGSDYAPVPSVAPVIANVHASEIDDAEREQIFFGNAQQLLRAKGLEIAPAPVVAA
jgi:predicted TIM-barrel fold metal-dependent hydrolase